MNTAVKIWLIVAASLVALGLIVFAAVMTAYRWDFTGIGTSKYETNTHELDEKFENISINTNTADIVFALSEDGKCRVVCCEETNMKHSVAAKDGTLSINLVNEKKWYEYIGIGFGKSSITVYLPKTEYGVLTITESTGDVEIPKEFSFESIRVSASTGHVTNRASAQKDIKITTSTGDIRVESIVAGSLELSVSTGHVAVLGVQSAGDIKVTVSTGKTNISDVRCKNLITDGNTGDISLTNVIATERFSIERSTGDVKFDRCDASEIFAQTDTGSVTGTLLSDKVFIPKSDTGDIHVPKTVTGGRCEITTDTGNIRISVLRSGT